jgi:hypothetical protein
MSFTEQTDPNAPVTPPPAEAPVIAPKASSGIAPDVKLPGRSVFLTAPQLAEIKEEDILGGTVSDSGDAATRQRRGFDVIFQGQKLLNKSGVLERGLYQDEEAESELARMTKADRDTFQNALASRGLYGKNGRPLGGTGFGTEDISVTKEFIRYANGEGLTLEAALDKFLAEVKPYVAPRRVIRTTAKQDIRSVLQKTTQEILGRSLSPNEIEKFVKTYERMEITEAMGGVRAPNLAVAAEEQVQQQFGPEAQAVGALGLFDILDRKIKGQA